MKEKKQRKHVITDKAPVIVALILMSFARFFPDFAAGKILGVVTLLYRNAGTAVMIANFSLSAVFSVITLLIVTLWFRPEYRGDFSMKGFGRAWKLLWPFALFWVVLYAAKAVFGMWQPFAPNLFFVLQGIRPAVIDEIAFRGLGAAILLRAWNDEENVWIPAVFAGVLSGLPDLLGTQSGQTGEALIAVLFGACMGIAMGAVYTLAGNLWAVVIFRALYDVVSLMGVDFVQASWTKAMNVGGALIFAVVYVIILRKRSAEASALWKEKWSQKGGEVS